MNLLNPLRLDKKAIKKSFNRSAGSYNRSAVLQNEILNRLVGRLDYINLKPQTVLDIGCGTGKGIKLLARQFPKSMIIGIDLAHEMLLKSKKEFNLFKKSRLINCDMEALPIKDSAVDLIFSNLAIQWVNDLEKTFSDFMRLGNKNGLLMFTTFGPNTLWELHESWGHVDKKPHVHSFLDMHDIGDMLVNAGFAEPVMDSEIITLEYTDFKTVLSDLKNIGANNASINRPKGLMTPSKLKQLEHHYKQVGFKNKRFVASYEVIYGHAWM